MRTAFVGLALGMAAQSAAAQPSQTTSWAPQSGPPGVTPPYAYQPPANLTEEDRDILATGEISGAEVAIGGAGALFLGFGAGQAFEGRWHDTGWIFSLGEAASIAAIVGGLLTTCSDRTGEGTCHHGDLAAGVAIAGLFGFLGFRAWEVGDAFIGPSVHNRRVHEIRRRLGYPDDVVRFTPYLSAPRGDSTGGVAGLSVH